MKTNSEIETCELPNYRTYSQSCKFYRKLINALSDQSAPHQTQSDAEYEQYAKDQNIQLPKIAEQYFSLSHGVLILGYLVESR